MRSGFVAAAVLATCMTALGAPAASAQQDEDPPQPAATATEPTGAPEPTGPAAEPEPTGPAAEPEPTGPAGPQPSPIDVTLALNPAAAVPGQAVTATAACGAGDEASLTSPVLDPVVLTADPEGHQPWALHGTATVRQDARPGDYEVVAGCAGGAVSAILTVLPARGDADQVDRVPQGAPETGGGPQPRPLALLLAAAGTAGLAGLGGLAARRAARR